MNPADKLQEIADKISALAKALNIIQEELTQAIASIRAQLQNPPGPPSSRPKLPLEIMCWSFFSVAPSRCLPCIGGIMVTGIGFPMAIAMVTKLDIWMVKERPPTCFGLRSFKNWPRLSSLDPRPIARGCPPAPSLRPSLE